MTLDEFEKEFLKLGENYKTKDVDRLNRQLIRQQVDVSFLRPIVPQKQEYYRTYFQVSIGLCPTLEGKMQFIEDNLELMQDWWHTDCIPVFLGKELDFDTAYQKACIWVQSDLPYARRLGYIIFIPRLVKDREKVDQLLSLLKNDDVYHVVMGEAWLISFLGMCDPDKTYDYLKRCDLKYNIVGKAIQKICDSYVVSPEDKERFKSLRSERKLIR